METIFPEGIKAGSLILISGPPGSGKTLLCMQLLREMYPDPLQASPNTVSKRLLLSADQPSRDLMRQVDTLLIPGRKPGMAFDLEIRYLPQQYSLLRPTPTQPLTDGVKKSYWSLDEQGRYTETLERRAAVDDVMTRIDGEFLTPAEEHGRRFAQYVALGLDGIMNLPEVRGATLDERREALHEIARHLKECAARAVQDGSPVLAVIMTGEASTAVPGHDIAEIEEYLADVVIKLGIETPVPRKRRRFLEVRKSRYVEPLLGEHSLWIMSPREVQRRKAVAATMGWCKEVLECIRPGIVVFPRMRWRPERGAGPVSENLEQALVQLRTIASKEPAIAAAVLEDEAFARVIEDVVRGTPLRKADMAAWWIKMGIVLDRAIRSGWRWPPLGPQDWECDLPARLDLLENLLPKQGPMQRLLNVFSLRLKGRGRQLRKADLPDLLKAVAEAKVLEGDVAAAMDSWSAENRMAAVACAVEVIAAVGKLAQSKARGCSFGIRGLDGMFNIESHGPRGVVFGTSTVLVGGPGTDKSTLACCFLLKGLLGEDDGEPEDVIFLGFDERHKAILREFGDLTVETAKRKSGRSQRLASAGISQVLRAELPQKSMGRICFIHQNPVNADLDEIMFLLDRQIRAWGPPRSILGGRECRPCRLIIDSLSDLERNIRDPLVFNDMVTTLLNRAADWGVTTLLLYEDIEARDSKAPPSRGLSFLADNVVLLRQVQVNNIARKCITIQKARGRRHDPAVGELVFVGDPDATFHLEARKGFEGMSKVLTGRPEPANIELRLFHENNPEKQCNDRFYEEMRARFGDRVRYVPFGLYQGRRAFWHRVKGGDIRPDADVTVVSLDQPWVRILAENARRGDPLLAVWDPAHADPSQRLLLGLQLPRVREHAEIGKEQDGSGLKSMLAWPHYFDFGLLLERTDLLSGIKDRPTHWDQALDAGGKKGRCGLGESNSGSFEKIVGDLSRQLGVPGLAFNMDSIDTVACVFIEMCWNFFAKQAFLRRDRWRNWNIARAVEALAFLARLRWQGVLPYPCRLEHCAEAIYTRVWYANVPNLMEKDQNRNIAFRPIPLFTSSLRFRREFKQERAFLVDCVRKAEGRFEQEKTSALGLFAPGSGNPYPEHAADFATLHQVMENLDRVRQRREELERHHQGGRLAGWSCCGAWFLGVLSSGGNANLGWSIVQEAMDPRRVEERALAGAGLPALEMFYRQHGNVAVPGLQDTSFGQIERNFFGRIRPRETALGIGLPGEANQPDPRALDFLSSLPEVLHSLVMCVLGDGRSDPNGSEGAYREFIRAEVTRVFEQTDKAMGVMDAPEGAALT